MAYKINTAACTGCHACAGVCPAMAISDDPKNPPKCKIDPAQCMSCSVCASVCPASAIAIDIPAMAPKAA